MVIMLVVAGGLFALIFAVQGFKSVMMKKYMSMEPPPITVTAMKAKSQTWEKKLGAIGTLRAVKGVDVASEIAGLVRNIHIPSGKNVCRGDILVKLNDDTERAQLESLIAQERYASQKYERDKAQFQIKAVSQQVLDEDVSNLKSMRARINEQKAIIDKKTIRAPFSGKVGITTINPGQYINPGDMIVTLQTLNPILIDFTLPQQVLKDIAVGQDINVKSDSFPQERFTGKITAINPKIDVATRNVQIEARLENPKQLLIPGMFANVEIIIGQPESFLTLPQTAISFNPYGEIAYLIGEQKEEKGKKPKAKKWEKPALIVKQIFVKVGQTRGDQIAILSGVKEGDLVVTSGLLKLKNGTKVAINNQVVPKFEQHPKVADE